METQVKPVVLIFVDADANHNKIYRMIPKGDFFDVEYGRVGVSNLQTASYGLDQWNKKYNEKIKKGYTDQTHLMSDLIIEKPLKKSEYIPLSDPSVTEIVDRLQSYAHQAIHKNYTVTSEKVTDAMINQAQDTLAILTNIEEVEEFNKTLLILFSIIPRKMSNVSNYLATAKDDYARIISQEQGLLNIMKGQVVQKQAEEDTCENSNDEKSVTILEAMGIEMYPVNDEDIKKILNNLGSCSNKYNRAWRVKNSKTQTRFDKYVADEGNIQTKLLWHGSRNENWWSIINNGLILHPSNVVITGKMFGVGIYYSNMAQKSLGYTSLSGSYWAKGSSPTAFMGLYDVAYGKSYDVYSFDSKYYKYNYELLREACPGANCLHAHAGSMLRNDEIIVYREDQITIKYLVELKN